MTQQFWWWRYSQKAILGIMKSQEINARCTNKFLKNYHPTFHGEKKFGCSKAATYDRCLVEGQQNGQISGFESGSEADTCTTYNAKPDGCYWRSEGSFA